ncbi:hypothetical protein SSX86_023252 [Deinandra increscens subsp. villosa]|uniref:Maternal effect embryo arrest 22 n=1 Tax=Deinandra increscens subsp. villosa TaxID=3103831 RepID=A0AAP0GTA4_9ASTR
MKVESTTNPCCRVLQQKVKKMEDARAALKKALGIYEQQFDKMEDERSKLNKDFDELKLQMDDERKENEKESAARVSMENEISALKAEILSLSKKGGSVVSENVSEEELVLYNKGRGVFDKEKEKRAEAEQELSNLKAQLFNIETEKKKLMQDLQIEKKRAGEMLKTAETKQAEVEVLKAEKKNNNDLCLLKHEHQNLETQVGRLKELLENERKRAESEKKKAHKMEEMLKDEQSRVAASEQELSNVKTQLVNLDTEKKKLIQDFQKEIVRADSEKKRADETYKLQAMKEKSRADNLARQLEDAKKRTTNEHKVIQDLVSSINLPDTMKANSSEMKLLKKRLRLEKARVEYYKQVAKHEKKCRKTVEEVLHRVGLCSCFNITNVGNSCLEKDDNMNPTRKFMRTGSRKELAKPTKPCEYIKPNIDISTPSLPISGTCTESTSVGGGHTGKSTVAYISEQLCSEGKKWHAKIAKNMSELHGMLGNNDKPLAIEKNKEGRKTTDSENVDFNAILEKTCNDDVESFEKMFDGDCMKLLNFDSEAEEERYRVAVERPLSPTLPNVEFESSNLMDLDDSRSSESWSIVVFSDITEDSGSLSKIFHMTKAFSSRCCALSQIDLAFKTVISTLSADEILSPKEKVCVFFSLFLKSFSSFALTNFNHAIGGNFFSSSIHTFSGKLKNVMSDLETRTKFAKVCALEELMSLIQSFLINGEILVCSNDTSSETLLSLPDSKAASVHELVVGAVLLASVCEAFDRVDFICEISYTISRITTSCCSTLTLLLHVFAYACEEKLLHHGGDYALIMTAIKSLVTYFERENLSSSCAAKCPFSVGAISMVELASLLLKKLSECSIQMFGMVTYKSLTVPDDLVDVLSLLELLATKMSWGWVCKNIVTELLKMLETCAMEAPMTSIFVLLGQMTRLGIDANGFEDAGVESIRVKLISFLSQGGTSNKFSLPVQLAAVNALLATTPLGFQEICTNSSIQVQPPVGFATAATDCIQRWFSLLSDEHKSLSVRL